MNKPLKPFDKPAPFVIIVQTATDDASSNHRLGGAHTLAAVREMINDDKQAMGRQYVGGGYYDPFKGKRVYRVFEAVYTEIAID